MIRILSTSVALCFAIVAAQSDNNATDTTAATSISAIASSSPAVSNAVSTLESSTGPMVMIPVSESSEAALDTPTSTPAATTAPAPSPTSSDDMTLASPATETTEAALATPSSSDSPSFTFAPSTTEEAAASSTPDYTYAPTSTAIVTPVAPSPVTANSQASLDTPSDSSTSPAALVAVTETPESQLATPTESPNDTPAASSSPEYTFAPTTAANEAPSSTPEFTFAPTSAENTPAAPSNDQPKETSPKFTYAPSSAAEETQSPTVAPVPVPVGSSASFAVGSETIKVGETATVGTQPVIIQTNSFGNTEVQYGATGTPSMIAYPSSETELPQPSVTQNSNGDYMVGSLTLAPGSTITQGSGEATKVIGLSTDSNGSTQLIVQDSSSTATQALAAASSEQPSTFETQVQVTSAESQVAVLNGHTLTVASPAFSMPTQPSVITLNGHTISVSPSPTLPSNEIFLNGKTLTVSPVAATTSIIDRVITFQGHPISIGAATLEAQPTGFTSNEASSGDESLQGAAPKVGVQSWVCASLGMVFGAVALFL